LKGVGVFAGPEGRVAEQDSEAKNLGRAEIASVLVRLLQSEFSVLLLGI